MTFCPSDLGLTAEQELKLKKLVGPRYNPEKDMVKMSCESYDHQAQNKRYLSDQIDRLLASAKVRPSYPLLSNAQFPIARVTVLPLSLEAASLDLRAC